MLGPTQSHFSQSRLSEAVKMNSEKGPKHIYSQEQELCSIIITLEGMEK